MKKKYRLSLLTGVLAAALLAGCGSSKMTTEYAADTAAAEAPAMAAGADSYLYDGGYMENENGFAEDAVAEEMPEEEIAFETEGTDAEQKEAEVPENPQAGRKLITTMNVSAETEHFDELMGNLEKQITEMGGYIESSNQWNGSVDYYGNRINDRNASLTIRIPAEKLDSFLTMMEVSSNITNKSKSVEDVTLAYVDLESHKKALLAEEERLLELLEMAETVEDLISIEDKLANVRYQLESMESQLRTYDNRINYSTVYLDIQEVTRLTPTEEPTTWNRIKNGFSENLYDLGEGIKDFFIGVVINIPYIALVLILLAIGAFIGFLVIKHDRKKKKKRQGTAEWAPTKKNDGPLPDGVKGKTTEKKAKPEEQKKQGEEQQPEGQEKREEEQQPEEQKKQEEEQQEKE